MAGIPGNAKRASMVKTKEETTRAVTEFGVFLIDILDMTFMEGMKLSLSLSTNF
jgi:hypothetical protein